uniref:Uncharacterized protein n=1 Tax=Romanomermis culicivorax TaxID=13658 RepID=A0A915HKQ9_ROMCU
MADVRGHGTIDRCCRRMTVTRNAAGFDRSILLYRRSRAGYVLEGEFIIDLDFGRNFLIGRRRDDDVRTMTVDGGVRQGRMTQAVYSQVSDSQLSVSQMSDSQLSDSHVADSKLSKFSI